MVTINPFQRLRFDLNEKSTEVMKNLGLELLSINKPIREISEAYKTFKNEVDKVSIDYYHNFLDKFSDALEDKVDDEQLEELLRDLVNHNNECFRILSDQRREKERLKVEFFLPDKTEVFVKKVRGYTNSFKKINKAIDLMDSLACKYTIVKKEYKGLITDDIDHLASLYSSIGQRLTNLILDDDCDGITKSLDAVNSLLVELNTYLPSHLTKPLEKLYAIPFCDCYKDLLRLDKELEKEIEFDRQIGHINNGCRSTLKEVF
jgi:hypothetical protein